MPPRKCRRRSQRRGNDSQAGNESVVGGSQNALVGQVEERVLVKQGTGRVSINAEGGAEGLQQRLQVFGAERPAQFPGLLVIGLKAYVSAANWLRYWNETGSRRASIGGSPA